MNNRNRNGAEHSPEQAFYSPRARFGLIDLLAPHEPARRPPRDTLPAETNPKRTRREMIVFWLFLCLIQALSFLAFWLLWTKIHGHL